MVARLPSSEKWYMSTKKKSVVTSPFPRLGLSLGLGPGLGLGLGLGMGMGMCMGLGLGLGQGLGWVACLPCPAHTHRQAKNCI